MGAIFKHLILVVLVGFTNISLAQIKVACIGNSITYGVLLSDPSTESYPAQLQQLLGSDYYVQNFGRGNATLLYGFPNSYINSSQFTNSLLQHWDIIIICLGTNDTKDEYHSAIGDFIDDYKDLISRYDNYPGLDAPHCIVGIPPPIHETYSGHSNDYLVNEIIPRIKNVSSPTISAKANFYNALQDPSYFIDGIHTTKEGATIMAQVAKSAIELTLNPPPADIEPPATPSNFQAIGSDNSVQLSWNPNSEPDLYAYHLFRGTVLYGWMDQIAVLDKNTTSFTDNNVINGNTYYYQLSAIDNSNNQSSRTNPISATAQNPDSDPPSTPSNFTAYVNQGMVSLTWDSNPETDLNSYNIYRGTEDHGFKNFLANVDKSQTYYNDVSIDPNTVYYYQLDAKDDAGNLSDRTEQISAVTLRTENYSAHQRFILDQNFPNPFNPYTTISYSLGYDSEVHITIYDILGNEVKSLINGLQSSGNHCINWDGTNDNGDQLVGGIYFYAIKAGDFNQTKKMIYLK